MITHDFVKNKLYYLKNLEHSAEVEWIECRNEHDIRYFDFPWQTAYDMSDSIFEYEMFVDAMFEKILP
jgi:hypothetical protein